MSTLEGTISPVGQMQGDIVPRGLDGISPQVEVTEIEGGYHVKITDKEGVHELDLMHGTDGKDGSNGKDGADGKDGYTPQKGVDYFDGAPGKDGVDGKDGKDGESIKGDPGEDGIDGKDGRTINVWLAPGWNSADGRQDYIPMSDLVGVVAPSVETVLNGDIIICGQDGGILYVDVASNIVAGGAVAATAGTNVPDNWQDGSAVKIVGADGKDGVSPNLSIGTVTTLAAGSNATASITGTAPDLTLNLGIPKGADGAGGTGGGASADWSVNDESAEGYVKNRTHWREDLSSTRGITFVNDTLAFEEWSEGAGVYMAEAAATRFPSDGDLVRVSLDGFYLYRTVISADNGALLYAGNAHLLDEAAEDTGDNFLVLWDTGAGICGIMTTIARTSIAVVIDMSQKIRYLVSETTYPINGQNELTFDLGEGTITPGATYEIGFLRDANEGESGYVLVDWSGVVVENNTLIGGTGALLMNDEGSLAALVTQGGLSDDTDESHVYASVLVDAANVPDKNGYLGLFQISTDDPGLIWKWHQIDEKYLPESFKTDITPVTVPDLDSDNLGILERAIKAGKDAWRGEVNSGSRALLATYDWMDGWDGGLFADLHGLWLLSNNRQYKEGVPEGRQIRFPGIPTSDTRPDDTTIYDYTSPNDAICMWEAEVDENGGVTKYEPVWKKADSELDENSERPVQNKVVAEALKNFTPDSSQNGGNADQSGLTDAEKSLILTLFRNAAYTSNGMGAVLAQLESLWSGSGEVEPDEPVNPEKTLTSISAVYSGDSVAVGTAVNALTGIVVTAHYSDGTSATVTGYTLSGTIAEGSNTITVSYGGKTTTFTVTGIAESTEPKEVKYNIADYATTIHADTSAYEALFYDLGNPTAGGYGRQTGETCYILENIKAGDVIEFGFTNIASMSETDTKKVLVYDADGDLTPDNVPLSDFKKEMQDNYSWYIYKCTIANDHDKIYFWIGKSTNEKVLAYVPTLTRYE